jgi:uncharacterized membrane protein YadS
LERIKREARGIRKGIYYAEKKIGAKWAKVVHTSGGIPLDSGRLAWHLQWAIHLMGCPISLIVLYSYGASPILTSILSILFILIILSSLPILS